MCARVRVCVCARVCVLYYIYVWPTWGAQHVEFLNEFPIWYHYVCNIWDCPFFLAASNKSSKPWLLELWTHWNPNSISATGTPFLQSPGVFKWNLQMSNVSQVPPGPLVFHSCPETPLWSQVILQVRLTLKASSVNTKWPRPKQQLCAFISPTQNVNACVDLSVCLSVGRSVRLSVCLSLSLSVSQSVSLPGSICLSVCLSICLSI